MLIEINEFSFMTILRYINISDLLNLKKTCRAFNFFIKIKGSDTHINKKPITNLQIPVNFQPGALVFLLDTIYYYDQNIKEEYFLWASKSGFVELVKKLIIEVKLSIYDNFAIKYASKGKHYKVVRLLQTGSSKIDPTAENNFAFLYALCGEKNSYGSYKITKILFQWLFMHFTSDSRIKIYKQIAWDINTSEFSICEKIVKYLRENVPELINLFDKNILIYPKYPYKKKRCYHPSKYH